MGSNLTTIDAVVSALGGRHAVAAKAAVTYEAVCNWARDGLFPSKTYVPFQTELRRLGYQAPDRLWRMIKFGRASRKIVGRSPKNLGALE